MSFPDEETLLWAKKKFGGGGGGGNGTVLRHRGNGTELTHDIPVGMFHDNYGFCRLWDNTPNVEDILGGVLISANENIQVPMEERFLLNLQEYGLPVYMICADPNSFLEGKEPKYVKAFLVVVLEELSEELAGVPLYPGIYVQESFVSTRDDRETILVYPGSANNSGNDSSGGGSSYNGAKGAMWIVWMNPDIEDPDTNLYKISDETPTRAEIADGMLSLQSMDDSPNGKVIWLVEGNLNKFVTPEGDAGDYSIADPDAEVFSIYIIPHENAADWELPSGGMWVVAPKNRSDCPYGAVSLVWGGGSLA